MGASCLRDLGSEQAASYASFVSMLVPGKIKVDYFILCFGRTDFTRILIDSIWERAQHEPVITLLNNGWIPENVPADIYCYWDSFVSDYQQRGLIAKVVDRPLPINKSPIDTLSEIEFLTDSPFYFISDNDCVAPYPDKNNVCFDQYAIDVLNANQGFFWKIGLNLYRTISENYAKKFGVTCAHLATLDYLNTGRFCADESGHKDYLDETGGDRVTLNIDPRISLFPTDTTLSIIKKPMLVTYLSSAQGVTFTDLYTLHTGYFEPFWFSNATSIKEMILYHKVRPTLLPQHFNDYMARFQTYLSNFAKLRDLGRLV